MRLLLDTHTIVWWAEGSAILSPAARSTIEGAGDGGTFVSPISGYEMLYKYNLGKWPEVGDLARALTRFVAEQGFSELPLTLAHTMRAANLPLDHRDPFDRMLAAQALVDDLTIVSIDDKLDQFGVRRLW